MANGIRTGDPHGFNKGRCPKFHVGSWVQRTPEEGQRTYWPKHCGNNNKDEDNSLKTLNDKNHQASSQKFRQLISFILDVINLTAISLYNIYTCVCLSGFYGISAFVGYLMPNPFLYKQFYFKQLSSA